LEAVVLRCLAKDPTDRYQRAEEVDTALAACSSADDWDAQKAADWWKRFEPSKAAFSAVV
jgi:serine/threonine-protein kinase